MVGVSREARRLKLSTEKYYAKWKDGIKNSDLSLALRDSVLSNMDFNWFLRVGRGGCCHPAAKGTVVCGRQRFLARWRCDFASVPAKANRRLGQAVLILMRISRVRFGGFRGDLSGRREALDLDCLSCSLSSRT